MGACLRPRIGPTVHRKRWTSPTSQVEQGSSRWHKRAARVPPSASFGALLVMCSSFGPIHTISSAGMGMPKIETAISRIYAKEVEEMVRRAYSSMLCCQECVCAGS